MSATSEEEHEKLDADGQSPDASSSSSDSEDFGRPPPLQHNFAPPFYGRPPTPLPPSPSLTSLLRPSRPTTPDASDVDQHDLEPVPRASPVVPTYEYYGFVLYLFSTAVFLMYILWSYLPSPVLHYFGIYYYPNRWWSLAIPSFLVMTLVYIFVALGAYNGEIVTVGLEDVETMVDATAMVAGVNGKGRGRGKGEGRRTRELRAKSAEVKWETLWDEGTDAVMDVPLAGVCEILYGRVKVDEVSDKPVS